MSDQGLLLSAFQADGMEGPRAREGAHLWMNHRAFKDGRFVDRWTGTLRQIHNSRLAVWRQRRIEQAVVMIYRDEFGGTRGAMEECRRVLESFDFDQPLIPFTFWNGINLGVQIVPPVFYTAAYGPINSEQGERQGYGWGAGYEPMFFARAEVVNDPNTPEWESACGVFSGFHRRITDSFGELLACSRTRLVGYYGIPNSLIRGFGYGREIEPPITVVAAELAVGLSQIFPKDWDAIFDLPLTARSRSGECQWIWYDMLDPITDG